MARILIIDDDPDMRSLLEQTLKSSGHEIEMAADGKEGLRLYDSKRADVVITDLYMPKKGGLETIIELRRRSPDIPIIALSGTGAADKMLSIAQKFGAFASLHKPFTPEELEVAVRKAIDKKA
jgi:two-component system, NtrC family, response regulator AtoC